MYSPEMQSQIAAWRAKVADGSITIPELTEAFKRLRAERSSAQAASAKSKAGAKSKKAPVDTAALKAGLLAQFGKK